MSPSCSSCFHARCEICRRGITVKPLDVYRETGEKLANVLYLHSGNPKGIVYRGLRIVCQGECDREMQGRMREFNARKHPDKQIIDAFDCIQEIALAPLFGGWEQMMLSLESGEGVRFDETFRREFQEFHNWLHAKRRENLSTLENDRARALIENYSD